jgi:hypothetical protein
VKVTVEAEHSAVFTVVLDAGEVYEIRKRFAAASKLIRVKQVILKSAIRVGEKTPQRDFVIRGARSTVKGEGAPEGDSYWDLAEARRMVPKPILAVLLAAEAEWLGAL